MAGHASAGNGSDPRALTHYHPDPLAIPSLSTNASYSYEADANDSNYGDVNNMSGINDANGLSPGGGSYSSRSSRYKMAIASSRQRRLRRMRDPLHTPNSGGRGGRGGDGTDSLTYSSKDGDISSGGSRNNSFNSFDGVSSPASPPPRTRAAAPMTAFQAGTPPLSPPQRRLHDNNQRRNSGGGGGGVSPTTPASVPHRVDAKVVSPYDDESPSACSRKSPPPTAEKDMDTSRDTSRDDGVGVSVSVERTAYSPRSPSSPPPPRKKHSSIATEAQEYIPDWKAVSGGWDLSPDEVRDAANFTKIQFQIAGPGSEVEMLSGDECDDAYSAEQAEIVTKDGGSDSGVDVEDTRQVWQNDVWSDASTPSSPAKISSDIFHQNVGASLVSLLSADRLIEAGLMAPEISTNEEDEASKDVGGDSPDDVNNSSSVTPDGWNSTKKNLFTFEGESDPSASRGGEWQGMIQVTRSLFSDDLDDDVRQSMIFQAFRKKMIVPSEQFSDLLSQINRTAGTTIDRAFATRRKNACGALKILSAKEENKMKICWTVGVLPAIASVLGDVRMVNALDDHIAFVANAEARNRVIATLLNMCLNKKNRMLIVNTPGVLDSMVQTIAHDGGEGRQGCCTILFYLAKTAEARIMIVKGSGVLDALINVIKVPKDEPPPPKARRRIEESYKTGDTTFDTMDTGQSRSHDGRFLSSKDDSDSDYHSAGTSSHSGSHSSTSGSAPVGESRIDDSTIVSGVLNMVETSRLNESTMATVGAAKMVEISFYAADPASNSKAYIADKSIVTAEESNIDMYDADPNRFLHGARLSVFACLLCLVKSQENAFIIARMTEIIETLLEVSRLHRSPSHSRAIAVIAHLTRHPKNCHQLVFKYASLLPVLQAATDSPDKEARRYAFCALQNLSMDKSCRAPIAHSPMVFWSLIQQCKKSTDEEHEEDETRMAAIATLQNLSDEPANVIQFTIVQDCISTIIEIAMGDSARGKPTDLTSFMAKNTLATLSHWFRKIASSGAERVRKNEIATARTSGRVDPRKVSPNATPGGTRAFVSLSNAMLVPEVYDQWS